MAFQSKPQEKISDKKKEYKVELSECSLASSWPQISIHSTQSDKLYYSEIYIYTSMSTYMYHIQRYENANNYTIILLRHSTADRDGTTCIVTSVSSWCNIALWRLQWLLWVLSHTICYFTLQQLAGACWAVHDSAMKYNILGMPK